MNRRRYVRPATAVTLGFATLIATGTALLSTPFASAHGRVPFIDAVFTATSAACLTGLITVDTATAWTPFGHAVIMTLIQLGGLGFMTLACLLSMALGARLGLRRRLGAQAEGRGLDLGQVTWVVQATLVFSLLTEAAVATVLTVRFATHYGYSFGRALWEGVFHAISAFNNAGFALYSDNVVSFATDAVILLPLAFAIMIGGFGFPVLLETARRAGRRMRGLTPRRMRAQTEGRDRERTGRRHWSLTAVFTLTGTAMLVIGGSVFVGVSEWNGALGHLDTGERVLNAFFAGVSPRTAGFNAVDYAEFSAHSLLGTDVLMFIGGGSGGTAGGIKITTLAVILAAILAEIRGDESVRVHGRTINRRVVRQALTVVSGALILVMAATITILAIAPQFNTDQVLFEATSAFGTVGLSTGITSALPMPAKIIIILLMYIGRLGPLVVATALAGRTRVRLYDYPEERPAIG